MSITIDLEPAVEYALLQRAEAAGLTLEEYALKLLEDEADGSRNHSRFEESLKIIESYRGKLGPVPEGALDPELLYGPR